MDSMRRTASNSLKSPPAGGKRKKLISLNLIFSYPVSWSRYKVLRDFIQNFYDAVGSDEWMDRFTYRLEEGLLVMEASDVSFSYDWLIHIGASTKRDTENQYAGYFGEGFKIASLCALRDHGWEVSMESKDWGLEVGTTRIKVDDTRFRLPYIALKSHLFDKKRFGEAMSTYLHEFAHSFGGDQSRSFSQVVTEFLEIAIIHSQALERCRLLWEKIEEPR